MGSLVQNFGLWIISQLVLWKVLPLVIVSYGVGLGIEFIFRSN